MEEKNSMNSLIPMMEGWFKGLPKLPASVVDFLVMIAPWLALIFGILGVLGTLAALGILTAFAPLAMMGNVQGYGVGYIVILGGLISSVLGIIAFPGLNAKKIGGWNLLFWSEIVSIVASVLSISIGGVIGTIIGFYILFQIKSRYK